MLINRGVTAISGKGYMIEQDGVTRPDITETAFPGRTRFVRESDASALVGALGWEGLSVVKVD